MKAEKSLPPDNPVKTAGLTNNPTKGKDALWSNIRRLTDRVQSIELAVSTARRDINRIDKRQYRAADSSQPPEVRNPEQPAPQPLNPVLFGQ